MWSPFSWRNLGAEPIGITIIVMAEKNSLQTRLKGALYFHKLNTNSHLHSLHETFLKNKFFYIKLLLEIFKKSRFSAVPTKNDHSS